MSDVYRCSECDVSFNSNFKLYQHKARLHTPVLGIMANSNTLKRKENPPATDDHIKKYIKAVISISQVNQPVLTLVLFF